jgi:transposase
MEPLIREVIMVAAHSDDLRLRVVEEVMEGRMSRRAAASHFRVSAASAIRWVALKGRSGSVSQLPRGGRSRSPLEPHATWLLNLVANESDLTLADLVWRVLQGLGLRTTETSLRRFFKRHKISFKKNSARLRTASARRRRGATGLDRGPR